MKIVDADRKLEIPFYWHVRMKLEVPEPYSLTVLHPSDPFYLA